MATGGKGRHVDHGFQELIEDRGTCAVCLDIVKDHRALPCQHVFCLTCLKPLVRGNNITCPTCQDDCILKKGNVESLPKSLFLVDMLDKMCVDCRQRTREMECPHCKKWLCSDCLEPCREAVHKLRGDIISQFASFTSDHCQYVVQVRDEQTSHKTHTESIIKGIRLHFQQLLEKLRAAEKVLVTEVQAKSRTTEKAFTTLIDEAHKLNKQVQDHTRKLKAQDDTLSPEIFRMFEEVKATLDKNPLHNPLPGKYSFKPHGICVIEAAATVGELVGSL